MATDAHDNAFPVPKALVEQVGHGVGGKLVFRFLSSRSPPVLIPGSIGLVDAHLCQLFAVLVSGSGVCVPFLADAFFPLFTPVALPFGSQACPAVAGEHERSAYKRANEEDS